MPPKPCKPGRDPLPHEACGCGSGKKAKKVRAWWVLSVRVSRVWAAVIHLAARAFDALWSRRGALRGRGVDGEVVGWLGSGVGRRNDSEGA